MKAFIRRLKALFSRSPVAQERIGGQLARYWCPTCKSHEISCWQDREPPESVECFTCGGKAKRVGVRKQRL